MREMYPVSSLRKGLNRTSKQEYRPEKYYPEVDFATGQGLHRKGVRSEQRFRLSLYHLLF